MSVIRKGVTYANKSSTEVIDCIFCRITNRDPSEPARVVADNGTLVAFHTIKPVSPNHLLISPKVHIQNINSLSGEKGAALLEEMVEFGRMALGRDAETAFFCFHVPPVNSIDHLHLHAIGRSNEMSFIDSIKYSDRFFWCTTASALIQKLRSSSA